VDILGCNTYAYRIILGCKSGLYDTDNQNLHILSPSLERSRVKMSSPLNHTFTHTHRVIYFYDERTHSDFFLEGEGNTFSFLWPYLIG